MARILIPVMGLIVLSSLVGCGTTPAYNVTIRPESTLPGPVHCRIGEMLDSLPAGFAVEKKPTQDEIDLFKSHLQEDLSVKDALVLESATSTTAVRYTIVGVIRDFKRGNAVLRFFLPFGVGDARFACTMKLIDTESQTVIFSGEYSNLVWGEFRDDEAVFSETANDFANNLNRELKKHRSTDVLNDH